MVLKTTADVFDFSLFNSNPILVSIASLRYLLIGLFKSSTCLTALGTSQTPLHNRLKKVRSTFSPLVAGMCNATVIHEYRSTTLPLQAKAWRDG